MVEISIICLIYKSKRLAEAVYESAKKYTPKLKDGSVEFFFVANDPTKELVDYLESENIPHHININEKLSDEELFKKGYGSPEYIRRVYQGYNYGILKARGQKILLINSDNFFSEDWLENLLKYSDYKTVVCSTLVEPGHEKYSVFPFAIEKDFGRTLDDFREDDFQEFVSKKSRTGFFSGGAYMPCLLYKDVAILAGLYPEGNIAGKRFDDIKQFGDECFYDKLKAFGIEHITAKDSFVYHLKEGEISEKLKNPALYLGKVSENVVFNTRLCVKPRDLVCYIKPESIHGEIMSELSKKITIALIDDSDDSDIKKQMEIIDNFDKKNVEIVVLSKNVKKIEACNVDKIIDINKKPLDLSMYRLFFEMYGEHLLVLNDKCNYSEGALNVIDDRSKNYYIGENRTENGCICDFIGNFIFSKKDLTKNPSKFLGYLVEKGAIEVKIDDIDILGIDRQEVEPPVKPVEEVKSKHGIIYRAARKIYREGPISAAKSVRRRIIK
jgi:hypothetical protein